MNIIEAMMTGEKFTDIEYYEPMQYFSNGTGPYQHLFDCGYFMVDGEASTTMAFYGDEILGEYRLLL